MAGLGHLPEFQKPALRALVDMTEEAAPETWADAYLPTETTYNRKFAYEIIKNQNFIAAYMGYGAEPPVVDRNAIADKAGEIAYFGLKHILTYEELQAINEARNNHEQRDAIDKLLIKTVDLLSGSHRLINLAKIEALTKGRFEAAGNIKATFDYQLPDENKVALAPGNDFDEADFDIVGFLTDQVDSYVELNGQEPDEMIVSRELNAKLLRNANIVIEAGRPAGTTRVNQEQLKEVFSAYDLPPIRVIGKRTMSWKDNFTDQTITREFMPANRIVMLGKGVNNKYLLGPTLENNFQPGLFLEAYDKKEPIQSIIRTVGAGFPILETPSLIKHIDAYTPK